MKRIAVIVASFAILLSSCKKDSESNTVPNNEVDSFTELQIPSNFKFQTNKVINLDVSITNPGFTNEYLIKVYDRFPSYGANLLYSGFSSNDQFTQSISVPATLDEIYLLKEDPNGSTTVEVLPLTSNNVTHQFGKRKTKGKTGTVSPDCSFGCDFTYNNHSGNLNINSNDPGGTYCFTGSYSGQINVNRGGVTIRICGNAVATNINLNNGSSLEVTDGASLTVNNLNLNSSSGEITFYNATVNITNNFSPNGKVTNGGILNVAKSFNINGNGELVNDGTIDITNNFNNNNDLTNNNSITVGGNCNLNGASTTINNCKLIVGDDLHVNNILQNNGLIDVNDDIKVNGGAVTTFTDGAMMDGADMDINSAITGNGTTSLIKISGNTNLNGSGSLNGNLEYCDANGIENNTGSINAPASLACSVYIPTSGCNTIGNGTPTVVDTDNDGVADANDLFPNDPDRAGESFYPGSSQYGTLAFEDLWPGLGDYDFNDLVVDYRIRTVVDANNNVKDVEYSYSLRAIGGSLSNGFGFQFDLAPSTIQSVSGTLNFNNNLSYNANGTEAGQSKAVIIVFDNAFGVIPNTGTQTVNTIQGENSYVVDTNVVSITFATAQSPSNLGSAPYNPFIYIGQDRGKEVHLSGNAPTDLVNNSYFGSAEDDSNPGQGRYYVNENNLPWAMEITQSFEYPVEKKDIVQTYNLFSTWAQSGGTQSTDWYINLAGYRDEASVY